MAEELRQLNEKHPLVLFPQHVIKPVGPVADFTIITTDMRRWRPKQTQTRRYERNKPIFVGSPVRPAEQGGLKRADTSSSSLQPVSKAKQMSDVTSCKSNIQLFGYLNELGTQRMS